jgi:predicted histidine transporter YuiF (NhaC family)
MMIGFHNLFLQMMYNKMTNRLLHADMMEVYKEAFAPKVYKNLGILETVFLNPRKGENYQLLQQVFNERKQDSQAPSVFDL